MAPAATKTALTAFVGIAGGWFQRRPSLITSPPTDSLASSSCSIDGPSPAREFTDTFIISRFPFRLAELLPIAGHHGPPGGDGNSNCHVRFHSLRD